VEYGETLVLDALGAVLLDVGLNELEVGLVGVHRVAEVVLVDGLLRVADESADGLNAGAGLQILSLNGKIKKASDFVVIAGTNLAQYADENLLEALKVPVLVNASVDDARVEDLLGLHGEEVTQVVDGVELVVVTKVFSKEVGK